MRPGVLLAVSTAPLVLALGCGSATPGGDGGVADGQGPSGDTAAGTTEVTVTVRRGPGKDPQAYRLRCDPAGGSHPAPEAACELLDGLKDPFAPVPPDTACTEIYGGPQTATVTGTFRGERVDAEFDRTNGCQITRWDEHAALLVERGGVDAR